MKLSEWEHVEAACRSYLHDLQMLRHVRNELRTPSDGVPTSIVLKGVNLLGGAFDEPTDLEAYSVAEKAILAIAESYLLKALERGRAELVMLNVEPDG